MKRSPLRKKSKITALKRKAWETFSRYIRNRDGWTCITCGVRVYGPNMQAGHFVHGDNMDFVYQNINAQCVRCNKWLHGNLGVYAVKIDEKWGSGTAKYLIAEGKKYRGYRRKDYEDVIAKYS